MTGPCPRCERELHPVALEAGRRCGRCDVLILDSALGVLLDGLSPAGRFPVWALFPFVALLLVGVA